MKHLLSTALCLLLVACGEERGTTTRGENTPGNFVPTSIGPGPDYSGVPHTPGSAGSSQSSNSNNNENDQSGGSSSSGQDNTGTAPPAGLPQAGIWNTDSSSTTENTCSEELDEDFVPTTLTIAHISETSFSIVAEEGERGTHTCITTENAFSCAAFVEESSLGEGIDALITTRISATGMIISTQSMILNWTTALSCVGSECLDALTDCTLGTTTQVSPAP